MDWLFDIVVGWVGGSIIFGLLFGLAGAPMVGVLVGTVVGIWWMRHRRWRELDESEQ